MSEHESQITVIGPDTHIKGEMSFERTARILGRFEGQVTSGGELQVGASAECTASLEAETVIVDGHVEGNVMARDRIQLNSTARVTGDVVAEKLIVAEGASFSGRCCVGPEAVAEMRTRIGTTETRPTERPVPETKTTGTTENRTIDSKATEAKASAFDWVGKSGGTDEERQTSGGWGPRSTTVADGAA